MKRWDGASAAAWTEAEHDRLDRLLNPGFEGLVTAVSGSAATGYQVQVVKTGETKSDGMFYQVEANGTVPAIGDRIQLHWQSDRTAIATHLIGRPRVSDQHDIKARAWWTGTYTCSAGWNWIGFQGTTYDPSRMFTGGNLYPPIPGYYLLLLKTGVVGVQSVNCSFLINDVYRGVGVQCTGSAGGWTEVVAVEVPHLVAGDKVGGQIYVGAGGNTLISDVERTYLVMHLLSAD